jgi:hypothetical protein
MPKSEECQPRLYRRAKPNPVEELVKLALKKMAAGR